MRNFKISSRLTLFIFTPLLAVIAVGVTGYLGLQVTQQTLSTLTDTVSEQANLSRLNFVVRAGLLTIINRMYAGTSTWEEASEGLTRAKAEFERSWTAFFDAETEVKRIQDQEKYGPVIEKVRAVFAEAADLMASRDRGNLQLFVTNDLEELVNPYFETLQGETEQLEKRSNEAFIRARTNTTAALWAIVIASVVGILVAIVLGVVVYRSIADPIEQMTDAVHRISAGNYDVRTDLEGTDELAELGQAFDQLLQERVVALVQAERENEVLNDSIIALLQAVSQLSQRDLTVRVPVTEDVTGPVADALNLLTAETAQVLAGVTYISEEVAKASEKVKSQSDLVIAVADNERQEVEKTAEELAAASEAMRRIADLAQSCSRVADNAIKTTQTALETVTNTVNGINNTRDTIRETEKRIKRLGERSQEISGAVNLINTIAERTHILALNASMHAASAGEAGRGFAVVADEVQRLAENSRDATAQIATLVSNIQAETADTVNTMNVAISQVVEGSRLAELAGEQMRRTQEATAELVASVQQIAARSTEQARISEELLVRAQQIRESTQQTSQRLQEQTIQTNNLVEYAMNLLSSVRVFKLPEQHSTEASSRLPN